METSVGAAVTFLCKAKGYPDPKIAWLINGVKLEGNELQRFLYLAGRSLVTNFVRLLYSAMYLLRSLYGPIVISLRIRPSEWLFWLSLQLLKWKSIHNSGVQSKFEFGLCWPIFQTLYLANDATKWSPFSDVCHNDKLYSNSSLISSCPRKICFIYFKFTYPYCVKLVYYAFCKSNRN